MKVARQIRTLGQRAPAFLSSSSSLSASASPSLSGVASFSSSAPSSFLLQKKFPAPLYRESTPILTQKRFFAENGEEVTIKVPQFADSITEGELASWAVEVGATVERDQLVAVVETDKIDIELSCPHSGVIIERFAEAGDTIQTGNKLYTVRVGEAEPKKDQEEPKKEEPKKVEPKQEEPKKEEPKKVEPKKEQPKKEQPKKEQPKKEEPKKEEVSVSEGSGEKRVKMSRLRMRVAERMKESQNTAASLTTFNEIDMKALTELRDSYKDAFLKKHGVKFGFMSAFIKASAVALQEVPEINARIEGTEIVYNDFCDISVAVATPKGLVTPVLRGVEKMTYLDIEKELSNLSTKARESKITIEDMAGGTFTISNGGVFGSLMGTPIINMPQSAILGMHGIKDRPVVVNGQIVIRPMMYVALTYDHRLIDGREAVTFLVRVKQLVEDPRRLLLDV